jgi:hypothetical protein
MFSAIRELLNYLSRGDAVTIMPVANDASGNLQGHILRFDVPNEREPYDEDLKRFRKAVEKALSSLEAESTRMPATHTDILGTLTVASEELNRERNSREVMLIIFSDFLEDDRTFKFGSDKPLRETRAARLFAEDLAANKTTLSGTYVFCGELRSREWLTLDNAHRAAVRKFWTAYLTAMGAKVSFATDGPARAVTMLRDLR